MDGCGCASCWCLWIGSLAGLSLLLLQGSNIDALLQLILSQLLS